jgi:hypothetical protein
MTIGGPVGIMPAERLTAHLGTARRSITVGG